MRSICNTRVSMTRASEFFRALVQSICRYLIEKNHQNFHKISNAIIIYRSEKEKQPVSFPVVIFAAAAGNVKNKVLYLNMVGFCVNINSVTNSHMEETHI